MSLSTAFSGDGRFLVLQLGDDWFCIEVATGNVSALPVKQKTVWGSISGPRVYACHLGGLWRVTLPAGEIEEVAPSGPVQPARGGVVARVGSETMRGWYVAPDESRAITMPTQLQDLGTGKSIRFGDKEDVPAWATWDLDHERVAVSLHGVGGTRALHVLDFQGKTLAKFNEPMPWFGEFDVGGRYVWMTGPKLCRGDINTGQVTVITDGPDQLWFWQADPVLGIGLDGTGFTLWNLPGLEAVRRVPIGEARPADADAEDPRTGAKLRLAKGCVLSGGAAATPRRERIALATFVGLRVYRIQN
ncbi:MAG TPA: hypothetical protein VF384_18485 [Planctomycetota bacterium]